MKHPKYFLSTIILLLLCACQPQTDSRLLSAEYLMDTNPDSAYRIICEIDTSQLNNQRDRALFTLLKTQAIIKRDSVLTDSTSIISSVNYFKDSGAADYHMKALYYAVWINFYCNDLYRAGYYVSEAYEIAKKLNDNYWIAKTAELTSILFAQDDNLPECDKFSAIAAENFMLCGQMKSYYYSKIDQAIALNGQDKYQQALDALEYVSATENNVDSMVIAYANTNKFIALYSLNRFKSADSLFHEMEKLQHYIPINAISYFYKSMLLCREQHYEQAEKYLDLGRNAISTSNDSLAVIAAEMYLASYLGNYQEAYIKADSLFKLNKNITHTSHQSVAALAQRDFYNDMAENERSMAEKRRLIQTGIAILLAISIIFGVIIYRIRMRIKNNELALKAEEILALSDKIEAQTQITDNLRNTLKYNNDEILSLNKEIGKQSNLMRQDGELRQKLMEFFQSNWKTIARLSRLVLECDPDNRKQFSNIVKAFRKEIDKLCCTENMQKIESLVNMHRDNIMVQARNSLQELNERDFRLLSLLYSGIDAQMTAIFMGIQRNSLGPYKARLIQKIRNCSSDNAEKFVGYILC